MNERLEKLIKAEGLTSAKFAEILSVQPSSISHLLSGRNKPNFDFLSRLLTMFPNVNPHWFINGEGTMYSNVKTSDKLPDNPENIYKSKDNAVTSVDNNSLQGNNLNISDEMLFTNVNIASDSTAAPQAQNAQIPIAETQPVDTPVVKSDNVTETTMNDLCNIQPQRTIKRVILFYQDNTFESFDSFPY